MRNLISFIRRARAYACPVCGRAGWRAWLYHDQMWHSQDQW